MLQGTEQETELEPEQVTAVTIVEVELVAGKKAEL